ncbi:arginine deiminase-related protein [soil metagenome]
MPRFLASDLRCAGGDHPRTAACGYQVAWTINPHMIVGSVDRARALDQHARLLRTVRALGAEVVCLPFVHGGFDSVFVKDNALYLRRRDRDRAVLGAPRFEVRRLEQRSRGRDLGRAGFEVDDRSPAFEGGDLCVLPGGGAFLGHGFRSSPAAIEHLARILGGPVTPLELVDPELYHLDTALAALADGTVLACEAAFSAASRETLRRTARGEVISIARDEAVRFALNLVEVGDTIVTGTDSAVVAAALRARGKRVIVTPLDEFHRAGGSVACLRAPIHDLDAQSTVAISATAAMRSTAA